VQLKPKALGTILEKLIFYLVAVLGILQFGIKGGYRPHNIEIQTPIITMNDSTFNAVKYLLDEKQLSEFQKMVTAEDRLAFIAGFWESSGSKGQNRDFNSRVSKADSTFDGEFRRGWKTDCGRVYILYGEPVEIIRDLKYYNTFNSKVIPKYSNLEIWYYPHIAGKNPIPVGIQNFDDRRMFFVFSYDQILREQIQIFSTEVGEKLDITSLLSG